NPKPNTPGYKIFLQPDNEGNTPLMLAVVFRKEEVVNVLLQYILKDSNAINEINRMNSLGDTALHLAFPDKELPVNFNIINLLISVNADFKVKNLESQSPIHFISQQSVAEQNHLLSHLEPKQQKIFLDVYLEYARLNRDINI